MSMKPRIVCLCGSTRFFSQFREANRVETLSGKIVLTCGVFAHNGDILKDSEKEKLDVLHFHKIALADEILVINPYGYIGESTKREIAYAESTGKVIRYLESPDSGNHTEA